MRTSSVGGLHPGLSINVGGITIGFSSITGEKMGVPDAYVDFLTNGEPMLSLDVYWNVMPSMHLASPLFDSGGLWSLYESKGNPIIQVNVVENAEPPARVVLKSDLSCGEVYIADADIMAIRYPLYYRLDEILTVSLLGKHTGVLLHALGLVDNGSACVFAGTSGAGKSTFGHLWKGIAGVTLLSDDRIIIRESNGCFRAFGTPWHGTAQIVSSASGPLERLFILRHASKNSVRRLSPAEAVSQLLVRAFPTFWDAEGMASTLQFLDILTQSIPCYDLGFVPDQSAVEFVRCMT